MNTLISVESCHRDRPYHEEIRQTWKKHIDFADVFFFLGNPQPPFSDKELLGDEVWLLVKDDLPNLTYKTQEIVRYAIAFNYDSLFKVDADTFIVGERLKEFARLNTYDYVGLGLPDTEFKGTYYAWGGAGYWLSKKAMQVIVDIDPDELFHMAKESEDTAVGRALYRAGIVLHNDTRFAGNMQAGIGKVPKYSNDVITTHHVLPGQMQAIYKFFYEKIPGQLQISRGTLIEPGKRYVVRDKAVYAVDDKGNIIQ